MRQRYNDIADQAVGTYKDARRTARRAYRRAADYPGTIAAIVLGIGITAALVWAARRAGGWRNLQEDAMDYARQGADYARQGVGYAREGYGKAREAIRDRVNRRAEQADQLTR